MLLRFAFMITCLLGISSCGGSPTSTIHGTVQYQGKPLAGGTITFLTTNQQIFTAHLDNQGNYQLQNVPRGPVKVGILAGKYRPPARPQPNPKDKQDPIVAKKGKTHDEAKTQSRAKPVLLGIQLPDQYSDPKTSGIEFELKDPNQEFSKDIP